LVRLLDKRKAFREGNNAARQISGDSWLTMRGLSPETKVGFLTIVAGIVLLYISFKTVGLSLFGDEVETRLYANFASVSGVEERSKVQLAGVEIGYVDAIDLADGHARVTIRLTRKADVHKDTVATIRTAGLLGESYIELAQSSFDSPLLKNGDTIAKTKAPADISDLARKLSGVMDDVKAVTTSLKNVFGTKESERALKNILGNIESASADIQAMLSENRAAMRATFGNLAELSGEFAKSAPNLAKDLKEIAKGLNDLIKKNSSNFAATVENTKELTAELKGILKENRENLKLTLTRVADASSKIGDMMDSIGGIGTAIGNVAKKVERGEGTVGKLLSDEEVYNNLNETLAGARKFLNKTEHIRVLLGFRGEAQTDQSNTKSFAFLRLQPREDKYYQVEVTEDLREKKKNDGSTNTLDSLLYTVLIAKKYSDLTIRGGLIESSVGVGAEYSMLGGRVELLADIFNFSGYDKDAENAQLKTQLKWNAMKNVYLYVGGDELLNDHYRTFLLGGGILFDENDLKLLFGLRSF